MRVRINKQLLIGLIFWIFTTTGLAQTEIDLDKLMEQIISNPPREKINDLLDTTFPLFEMTLLNGKALTTSDLRGKKTLINLWFTSCQPCLDEIPFLNEIRTELNSQEFNFIAITYQDSTEISEFLKSNDFNFTHIVNSRNIIDSLGVRFYPKTIILDDKLTIVRIEKRIPADSSISEIEAWKQDIIHSLKME